MSSAALPRFPRGVWVLGIVSMCMDLSSELVHSLLPLYMATALGASVFVIGMIEGVAEALALIVKLFSGVLSDLFRKRKPLVLLGYGLAARFQVRVPARAHARLDRRRATSPTASARAFAARRATR